MLQTMTPIKPRQISADPRRTALETLQRLAGGSLHADDLIDRELTRTALQGADRGLFAELVLGVLRRQATLDHFLGQLVRQPLDRLELQILLLLRLGLYQLRYLDRIPGHAAVYETVELAKLLRPQAAGLVNGVLRSYQRRCRELTLPDPQLQPAGWLAAAHSLPLWLAEQWLRQYGLSEAGELAAASAEPPPLTLRANRLRTGRGQLLDRLAAAGVAAEPCQLAPEGLRILQRCRVTELPGFSEGHFAVQDEASQLVVHLLDPQQGEQVLDMCAAPGGKATHLAELMHDRGLVLAADRQQRRIGRVIESAARLGLTCVTPLAADALDPGYLAGRQFDRVLLDAPCSGLGVIRRNPEAKWRLSPAEITRCSERQRLLLEVAAAHLKPGGLLVYATCSTAVEEDEAVVDDFLTRHPEFVVDSNADPLSRHPGLATAAGFLRCWPHRHGTDGFFAARLKRTA